MVMFWIVISLCVFIFQAGTILLLEYRRPANATAWLLILFLFPLVGFILYYFLATEYKRRRKVRKHAALDQRRRALLLRQSTIMTNPEDSSYSNIASNKRLYRSLMKSGELPISMKNHVEVYNNGEDTYRAMLTAIKNATQHIHMSTYIVRDDETGKLFSKALIEKAQQGVIVRLLYDGIGSIKLSDSFIRDLRAGGVLCACFFPIRPSFRKKRMNYRNHRKIAVIDGKFGYVGGINIGDEYIGKHPRLGFWRDTHLQLEGDSVYQLQEVFLKDWEIATKEKLVDPQYFPIHDCDSKDEVQIVSAGPDRRGDAIHETFYSMMSAAQNRIWITTPYFIPSPSIAMALHDAARSGLDVRIMMPYIPDTWLVHHASMSYAEEMLRSGVRVWQYHKGFIHAKTLLIDSMIGVVGSANMDLRSFFSNFEINAHLFSAHPIERIEYDFLQDMEASVELDYTTFRGRPRRRKVKEALARLLSPLL
ncbi:MAG: cardiolipin synthase [Candidatus Cohnella colombiensis]|uniref:Cardiolipin synthase n=1 Tax=Candidatus Cohnella colombiensis TaxID=3121368 RepID=A0AA95EY49_9BACL|nr:MAG: cardiolipin synthase [Cohnella sp.]